MLGKLFKRGQWQNERIEVAKGSSGAVSVTLRHVPCRREVNKGTLRYIDSEFGHDLMDELARDHLVNHQQVTATLDGGGTVGVKFTRPNLVAMQLELQASSVGPSTDQFLSEVLDAITNAFESVRLKP